MFLGASLSKIEAKLFSNTAWVLTTAILLQTVYVLLHITYCHYQIVWNCGILVSLVQAFQILF